MPKRNKNKRRTKRKQTGNRSLKVQRGTGEFVPAEFKTSLALSGTVENAASTTYAESGFTINDLFDPQGGSGAAQCPGFDQLAVLYNRYRVRSSKIMVRVSLNSSSATPTATAMEAQIIIYPSSVSTGAATVADGQSQPFAKTFFISGEMPKSCSMSVNISKFIGNSVNADRLQAVVSSSPSKILYWHIGVISRAYTNVSTTLQVRVIYNADFYERNTLDRSALFLMHQLKLQVDDFRKEAESKTPNFNNWVKPSAESDKKKEEKTDVLISDLSPHLMDDYQLVSTPSRPGNNLSLAVNKTTGKISITLPESVKLGSAVQRSGS